MWKKIITLFPLFLLLPQLSHAAEDGVIEYSSPRNNITENLAPTASDYAKAKADRVKGQIPKDESATTIEAKRDQNGHVVQYIVTPGSTKIPYKMKPQDQRVSNKPGHNDTLDTPKFINLEF